jgi:methylated-DNA-protein-cysteine methyltransferase-like protein
MQFRDAVYNVVRTIPKGRVLGYGHVAAILGEPRRARHVGFALSRLEPGAEVPWWRVIRSNGEIALKGDPTRGPLQRARLIEEDVAFVDRARTKVDMKTSQWKPEVRTVSKTKAKKASGKTKKARR